MITSPAVERLLSQHEKPTIEEGFNDAFIALNARQAYDAAETLHRHRVKLGWSPKGRKIGLTNRAMWARFGVGEPIWGTVYDRTLDDIPGGIATVDTEGLLQPRIEPEICFGLKRPISPEDDDETLLRSIDWVAHAAEIVQCPQPGWSVNLGSAIAFNGMHGRLLIGKRMAPERIPHFLSALLHCEVELRKNGNLVERGHATNVLDNPLNALRYLARVLEATPGSRALTPGEAVTTGTMTLAHSVAAGETWTSVLEGLPLPPLELRFV